MKADIKIDFKRIAGKKVNDKLLKENPKLFEVTKQTTTILCQQIKKYFQDNHIKITINFELKDETE